MSISVDGLDEALRKLHISWQKINGRNDWNRVELLEKQGTRFLRISRTIEVPCTSQTFASLPDDELVEEDEEALPPKNTRHAEHQVATYDIIHSPSFQVPVLYLTICNSVTGSRAKAEMVYELLVPGSYKSQMQAVGPLGALSLTDHPITGMPSYFVHPCRTRDAMAALLSDEGADVEIYLLLWIGAIGASVGLNVPVEVARQLQAGYLELNQSA